MMSRTRNLWVLLEQEVVCLVDRCEQSRYGQISILRHGYVHVGGVIVILLVGHL